MADIKTTDGAIALVNLQAQIDSLERRSSRGESTVQVRSDLADLLSLRGQLLGRIADAERAALLGEQLVVDAPDEGLAFLTRARTRAMFHRFADALSDLARAERLGLPASSLVAERAAALHQLGRSDEALALAQADAGRRLDFTTLGTLAALHAERGEAEAAESRFADSRALYRGVSPFPLAQLDFQRGHLWMAQGDLRRARAWFAAATGRVPAFAPAQGHLAETEAALGETGSAIARLRLLTESADDPDYAAHLARILAEAGPAAEARAWRDRAAARYEELMARHPAAFADHAAEFWLTVGGDPARAVALARINLEARPTGRAHALLARATRAHEVAGAVAPRIAAATIDADKGM